jgi:hypothetical protein
LRVNHKDIEAVVCRICQTLCATCAVPKIIYILSRYDGLLLLKTFLPQCSVEIFGENIIFWMQQCIKSVEGGQDKPAMASVSYQVLSKKIFSSKLHYFLIYFPLNHMSFII